MGVMKKIHIGVNVITFILGVIIEIVGIWMVSDKSKFVLWTSQVIGERNSLSILMRTNLTNVVAYCLLVIGALIMITAVIGFVANIKENKMLAWTYTVTIIIVEVLQIIAVILAVTSKYHVDSLVKVGLSHSLNNSYIGLPKSTDPKYPASLDWDLVMISAGCCGLNGPDDFRQNPLKKSNFWYNNGRTQLIDGKNETQKIPYACCKYNSTSFATQGPWTAFYKYRKDLKCGPNVQEYNKIGCFKKVKDHLKKYSNIIMGIEIAFGILLALGVGISCCCKKRDED